MNIKTKFEPGDDAYYMEDNHIQKGKIGKVEITIEQNSYHDPEVLIYYTITKSNTSRHMHESELFVSVEETLKHLESRFYAKGS